MLTAYSGVILNGLHSPQTLDILNHVATMATSFVKEFGTDSDFNELGLARFIKHFELDVIAEGYPTAEETHTFYQEFKDVVQTVPPKVLDSSFAAGPSNVE